jgi:hypothetical protein
MGRICSTHGRDEKFILDFGWKNLKRRDHLQNLDVDGKILK